MGWIIKIVINPPSVYWSYRQPVDQNARLVPQLPDQLFRYLPSAGEPPAGRGDGCGDEADAWSENRHRDGGRHAELLQPIWSAAAFIHPTRPLCWHSHWPLPPSPTFPGFSLLMSPAALLLLLASCWCPFLPRVIMLLVLAFRCEVR